MKKSMIVFSMISTVSAVYAINWLAPKTDSKDNPTVPSMSSWDNPANWNGGVKPGPDDTAGFGWENNAPNGSYSIVLGASQTIKTLQQNSWRSLPTPTYFGVEDDRLFGYTITLRNLTIGSATGGKGYVVPDVILSGDGAWSLNSGYNESDTIAIWGSISGPYGITKTDNGVAVLAGRNTYTGITTISEGKLQLGDGETRTGSIAGDIVNNATLVVDPAHGGVVTLGNLSGTGSVQKKGMGTLVFAGTDSLSSEGSFLITQHVWGDYGTGPIDCTVPNGRLSFSSYNFKYNFEFIGSESLDMGSGNIVLAPYDNNQNNAARTITVRRNKLVFGGPVSTSANMSLAKGGNGTLELKAASSYANSTAVNGGTLFLSDGGTAAGNITVGADGTLVLDNSTQTADRIGDAATVSLGGELVLKGASAETAGVLTLATGAATITVEDSDASSGFTFESFGSRAVGNTTLFDLYGSSAVSFSSFTAGTVLAGSVLKQGDAYSLAAINEEGKVAALEADGVSNVKINLLEDMTLTGATYGTLELCNDSGAEVTVSVDGTLSTENGLLLSGTSPIVVMGGAIGGNAAKEAIVLVANESGVTLETPVAADNITFGGVGDLALRGNLTAAANGNGYININVRGNIEWAQKNSSCGAVRFFDGVTRLASGSRLYEADSTSSGTRCYLRVARRATLDMNGVSAKSNGLTGAGSLTNGSEASAKLTCNWQPAGSNWQDYKMTFSGNITGNLGLTFTSGGYYASKYEQTLSGDNTFTGDLAVGGGMTFVVGSAKALGNGRYYQNGGNLNSTGRPVSCDTENFFKSVEFKGTQPLDLSDSAAVLNNAAVTLKVNARTLTLGGLGEAEPGSSLTKNGSGTLVLAGDNTYSGDTAVTEGVLQIDGKNESRAYAVDAGATLKFGESAVLPEKTVLSIAEGGTVFLHGYVIHNIKSLIIGDIEQEPYGTYGAIGSGATHEMACFRGPGKVRFNTGFSVKLR